MSEKTGQAHFARDFFFEVMKDSQRLRSGYLIERERWLRTLAIDGREEVLFEFEMLLRGLERYFNLHNLPLDSERDLLTRDFREELRAAQDAVGRAVQLTQLLLDPPSNRNLVFRRYLETQLADDRARGQLLERQLTQETPQESLFLIRSGFSALRGVLDGLLRLPQQGYQLFVDVGQLVVREIALNKYFRPFRPLEFRIEYDRIKSVRILEVLRKLSAPEERLRRDVSLAFLALFRLLHYLRYVPVGRTEQSRRGYLTLALVHSEASALGSFLEVELSASLAAAGQPAQLTRSVARLTLEIRKEIPKVLKAHLAGVDPGDAVAVGRAREGLEAFVKQWITTLAQLFEPGLTGTEVFDDFISRKEQANRLRLDLWTFRELAHRAEGLALKGSSEELLRSIQSLQKFVTYFRDVSYQLLRFGDFEPFDRFVQILDDLDVKKLPQTRYRRQWMDDCRAFSEMLSHVFAAVARREELSGMPFDEAEGQAILTQLGLA